MIIHVIINPPKRQGWGRQKPYCAGFTIDKLLDSATIQKRSLALGV